MLATCLLTTGYSPAYSNDAVEKSEGNQPMADGEKDWQLVWEDHFEGSELINPNGPMILEMVLCNQMAIMYRDGEMKSFSITKKRT